LLGEGVYFKPRPKPAVDDPVEKYVVHCKRNDRRGLAWLRTEIWTLGGIKGCGRTCPLYQGEKNAIHIIVNRTRTEI